LWASIVAITLVYAPPSDTRQDESYHASILRLDLSPPTAGPELSSNTRVSLRVYHDAQENVRRSTRGSVNIPRDTRGSTLNGYEKTNQRKTQMYPTHLSHIGGSLTIFVSRPLRNRLPSFEVLSDKLFRSLCPFDRLIRVSLPSGGLKSDQPKATAFSKIIATGCRTKNFNAPLPNLPRSMYSPPTWMMPPMTKTIKTQRDVWTKFGRYALRPYVRVWDRIIFEVVKDAQAIKFLRSI